MSVTWRRIVETGADAAKSAADRWPSSVSEDVAYGIAALVRRALLDLHAEHLANCSPTDGADFPITKGQDTPNPGESVMELVEILAEAMRHPVKGDEVNQYPPYRNYARRALTALHSRGLAVVPVVPTEVMVEAAMAADNEFYIGRTPVERIYAAMLSASPSLKGEG